MYESIKFKEIRLEKNGVTVTTAAQNVLTQMLKKDPSERLGAKGGIEAVQNHQFFKSVDFVKLERKEIPVPFIPKVKSDDDVSNIDNEFLKTPLGQSLQNGDIIAGVTAAVDNNFVGFSYAPPTNF